MRRIDPVADATTNTFGYLADIVGGTGLMPGLAVNVHLPRAANAMSFWIPRAAFAAATNLNNGVAFAGEWEKQAKHFMIRQTFCRRPEV